MPTKKKVFYPYPFADEGLSIKVLDVEIDNESHTGRVAPDTLTVTLQDLTEWELVSLHIKVRLTDDEIPRLLPPADRSAPPWRMLISLSCEKTRWRTGYTLKPDAADGSWTGTVELNRSALRDAVKMNAYLVRTSASKDTGFANRPSVRIASSAE